MNNKYKAGFVNIFGPPNAGKSTLLNAMLGERLAIVSPKVQTTRHRIHGFLTGSNYQIVFSDTPGIITPKYKLHTKMMKQVRDAVEDTDVALFLADVNSDVATFAAMMNQLPLTAPRILLLNKIDLLKDRDPAPLIDAFKDQLSVDQVIGISALKQAHLEEVKDAILTRLPEHPPFFSEDDMSDRSTRFFVSEMIREQIYFLYEKEIPYHAAVLIQSFEELPHIVRIRADIIVTRETQKRILLGTKGALIKELGIRARQRIEAFLGTKIFLELFVKVRPKWRDNESYLREYGY